MKKRAKKTDGLEIGSGFQQMTTRPKKKSVADFLAERTQKAFRDLAEHVRAEEAVRPMTLEGVEIRVGEVEKKLGALEFLPAAVDHFQGRVQAVEKRLDAIEGKSKDFAIASAHCLQVGESILLSTDAYQGWKLISKESLDQGYELMFRKKQP